MHYNQADNSLESFQTNVYRSISETKSETTYLNHKKSFNHEKHNEFWNIKAWKEEPVLAWKMLRQYHHTMLTQKGAYSA